jgi:hypothetical protein
MVGFFDILGFSDRVEGVQTETELVEIASTIESIRKHFEYRPKEKHVRQMNNMVGKQVLAFSDCVVTALSLHTKFARRQGIFDTIGSQVVNIALSQVQCIWDGYFLRGGVDFGYWYHHKGSLVSPALVAAYKEERERACYPVISISERLYELLRDDPGRNANSKDSDPLPDEFCSFKHPRGGIVHFINYLRIVASSLDWQYDRATYEAYIAAPRHSDERDKIMGEGYYRSVVAFFQRHKELIVSAHKTVEGRVKAKYRFLAGYHNQELQRFLPKRRDIRVIL